MGNDDEVCCFTLLGDDFLALMLEVGITDGHDFVHQIPVKVHSNAQAECETRAHAGRIGFYRRIEVIADFGELLHPVQHSPAPASPDTVQTTDESGVFTAGHAALKTAGQSHWPGNTLISDNAAAVGIIDAAHDSQQGGLAGAIAPENADILAFGKYGIHIPKQGFSTVRGAVGLGEVAQFNHRLRTRSRH